MNSTAMPPIPYQNISCVEFVPEIKTYNLITPNRDEFNEYFTIDNIEHYPNSVLTILNRYGKVIFATTGYANNWNGKINGETSLIRYILLRTEIE